MRKTAKSFFKRLSCLDAVSTHSDSFSQGSLYTPDGSKLFIEDREVVNNDGNHGTIERSGFLTLDAGRHPITVQYFQGGGQWLDVYYADPNTPRQIIPADRLFLQAQ